MDKLKKPLTVVSLVTMGLAVLILISAIFGAKAFEGVLFHLLLTLATVSVACFFMLNAINVACKNKTLAMISFSLIAVACLLGIITYWFDFDVPEIFGKFVILFSVSSVFFSVIVSNLLRLGKNYKVLQIITYVFIVIIDLVIILSLLSIDVLSIQGVKEVFFTICLVLFALMCTLKILARKFASVVGAENLEAEKGFVKIAKVEYSELLNKIKMLEEENERLKSNLR